MDKLTTSRWAAFTYFGISGIILLNFFLRLFADHAGSQMVGARAYAFGMVLALVLAQVVLILFVFAEDVIRFFIGLFSKQTYADKRLHMPSRRRFVSQLALGVAAIPFFSLIYGMIKGKYNYKVLEYELEFDDLPVAFDGYQITQVSDIHCGSFDNRDKVAYGMQLIREQKSDVIFFTGDLVNNRALETDSWKALFSTIKAPDGVFSILGNHDYGQYYKWDSKEAEKKNLNQLKGVHQEMGWDLLLNENRTILRDGEKLHIVGVENWGNGHFPKYGDIDKAAAGLNPEDFKIVLSHDPSHWREIVRDHQKNFQLTLSGHTHGMQFGIEIPGVIKWSPIKYRYKYWAGIYEESKRYINVNRGFGYLAYPGRVGIWPEITVIKLKKSQTA